MKKMFIFILITMTIPFTAASAYQRNTQATDEETKSFDIQAGGLLVLEADDGYIHIDTWNKDKVELTMHKRAWGRNRRDAEDKLDQIEINIVQKGNKLYIRDVTTHDRVNNFGLLDLIRGNLQFGTSVDFDLTIPEKMNIELSSDDGNIRVRDLEGEIDINLDDGDLNLDNIKSRRIEVDYDDGDIEIENVNTRGFKENDMMIITGDDGDIDLRDCKFDDIEINLDDGNVTLYNIDLTNLDVDIDDGDFETMMDVQNKGRVRVTVDDGDVELRLEEDISAYFNLFAYDGRIRTDFPIEVEREDGESWCKERVNGGNINIRVEVSDGYIVLKYK